MLFSDAKGRKDFIKNVVLNDFAGDFVECIDRYSQLEGGKFRRLARLQALRCRRDACQRLLQRQFMAQLRYYDTAVLIVVGACQARQLIFQFIEPGAKFGRNVQDIKIATELCCELVRRPGRRQVGFINRDDRFSCGTFILFQNIRILFSQGGTAAEYYN